MKYQMVNEELNIASCSIADLTLETAHKFLKLWKEKGDENATLGTLTLFCEPDTGLLVINRDNEGYQTYLEIAEAYLKADKKNRIEARKEAPGSLLQTLDVLENRIKQRLVNKQIFRAMKNYIESKSARLVLDAIIRKYDIYAAVSIAFRYGVMWGKHSERARRKRGAAV